MIWRLLLAIVLLVVVVGGIVGFNMFRSTMIEGFFANMQRPAVTVSTIEAEPVTWTPTVEAIGTASARRGVDLGVELGGIVEAIDFRANDAVTAGQPLVQIDDRIEQADLAAAQANLALSRETLARNQSLRTRGVIAAADLDTAQAAATADEANVVRLTAVMEQKMLTAPFDGTIGIPQIEVGQYVQPGTVYATLQDTGSLRVDFSIPEQQLRLIRTGMPILVTTEVDGSSASGEIVAIEPRIDPNSRLVLVRGEIDTPDGKIRPGQFLRVAVQLPQESGVIALPQTVVTSNLYGDTVFAVRTTGEGDQAKSTAEQVFVKLGRRADGLVEIVDGLKPGDVVVTAGQNRLLNGTPVAIDNSVNPTPTGNLPEGSTPNEAGPDTGADTPAAPDQSPAAPPSADGAAPAPAPAN